MSDVVKHLLEQLPMWGLFTIALVGVVVYVFVRYGLRKPSEASKQTEALNRLVQSHVAFAEGQSRLSDQLADLAGSQGKLFDLLRDLQSDETDTHATIKEALGKMGDILKQTHDVGIEQRDAHRELVTVLHRLDTAIALLDKHATGHGETLKEVRDTIQQIQGVLIRNDAAIRADSGGGR